MKIKIKHTTKLVCLLLPLVLMGAGIPIAKNTHITHEVLIPHPGKEGPAPTLSLIEVKGNETTPSSYFMDVISVYCIENICKIDTVRLFWNQYGDYIRYTLPPSIDLEKAEGKPFEEEDYTKLQAILSDKSSPFEALALTDIVKRNEIDHGLEVDAYTGATVIELDEDETVEGATLTCFTLWHWANGSIKNQIRNITGHSLNKVQLNKRLAGSRKEKFFALEQLNQKKEYDNETINIIVNTEIKDDISWNKARIQYLENTPDSLYFDAIRQRLALANSPERISLLLSLTNSDKKTKKGYYDDLCFISSKFKAYREADLFLSLMENRNSGSAVANQSAFGLLKSDILIARRAYWFLTHQEANFSRQQKKKIKQFERKNADYL